MTLGLTTRPNAGPSKSISMRRFFAVCASFETDDPPLWSAFLSPSTRATALRENRGYCLNFHEDTHSFRNCRHPFINARGCLNPELGQLGDDYAYRRWQARMTSYRRDGTSSRAHTKKTRRNRSGQTRGFHQDQDQVNSHSGNPVTNTRLTTICLLYTSPSPRDKRQSRMPSSA